MAGSTSYKKTYPISWEQLHRDSKSLAWRLLGMDYFKGIIAIKDDPDRYVLQGVHMIIEGDHQRPWKDGETHESRLVFIGRDLDEAELRKGFMACAA